MIYFPPNFFLFSIARTNLKLAVMLKNKRFFQFQFTSKSRKKCSAITSTIYSLHYQEYLMLLMFC
ncbi:CLUMA_CG016732, isoform A [Clunio marinus]|uniref:CLUMA_CG016732, isoform A n=1 Tax=Clunio marinus TaxID=568069 RepID=A0A1J1IV20_9DIPT|nr:CLUMA_CG016732, isoform A [Clunio marinus]